MFSSGFSEIVLIVEDVRKAAEFYRSVVGLTPETTADDAWAWFWPEKPGVSQAIITKIPIPSIEAKCKTTTPF